MSEAAAPAASGNLVINFNLPHETIYDSKEVASVIIPGLAGEYGVTAGHSAIVSQMKAGVLQILHTDGGDAEKYFVPGGERFGLGLILRVVSTRNRSQTT